jgi:hypothetical protein
MKPQTLKTGIPSKTVLSLSWLSLSIEKNQMSEGDINILMDLWAASVLKHGAKPPFANYQDLHHTIDSIPLGDIPWQIFTTHFQGCKPQHNTPLWMETMYNVWF